MYSEDVTPFEAWQRGWAFAQGFEVRHRRFVRPSFGGARTLRVRYRRFGDERWSGTTLVETEEQPIEFLEEIAYTTAFQILKRRDDKP